MLCKVCQDTFAKCIPDQNGFSSSWIQHQESIQNLRVSAEEGCYLCHYFYQKLLRGLVVEVSSFPPALDIETHARIVATLPACKNHLHLYIMADVHGGNCFQKEFEMEMWITGCGGFDIPMKDPEKPGLTTIVDDGSIGICREWLENCLSDHQQCKLATNTTNFFPTRILKIIGNPQEEKIKLHIKTNDTFPAPYLTLSHRWGTSTFINTVKSNVDLHTQGIDLETLPKTFRDAITITRMLGYSYLWIDSLCILQDSHEDWLIESKLMGRIYLNADCNLSAVDAINAESGLLNLRPHQSCRLELPWLHSREVYICERFSETWSTSIIPASLNKRGWVYQERLLSRRIIYFGNCELFWECHEHLARESYPGQFHNGSEILDLRKAVRGRPFVEIQSFPRRLYDQWKMLVHAYSSTQLTRASDKLQAILGISEFVSEAVEDTYFYGLWKGDLLNQLLWHSRLQKLPLTDPRAPSWSWAKMDTIVYFPQDTGKELCQILDIQHDRSQGKFAWIELSVVIQSVERGSELRELFDKKSNEPAAENQKEIPNPLFNHKCGIGEEDETSDSESDFDDMEFQDAGDEDLLLSWRLIKETQPSSGEGNSNPISNAQVLRMHRELADDWPLHGNANGKVAMDVGPDLPNTNVYLCPMVLDNVVYCGLLLKRMEKNQTLDEIEYYERIGYFQCNEEVYRCLKGPRQSIRLI